MVTTEALLLTVSSLGQIQEDHSGKRNVKEEKNKRLFKKVC